MEFHKYTKEELYQKLLFHGTVENIEGEIRGGSYDGILWTAESPAVAQTYMPASGIEMFLLKPDSFKLNEPVRPDTGWKEIAEAAGYTLLEEFYDEYNRLRSWSWGEKAVLLKDVVDFLENSLGYIADENDMYRVRCGYKNEKHIVYPYDYKMQGQLFIFWGKENLKIYDYAKDKEGSLIDLDYHKLSLFKIIEKSGYDAVRINDFCQSRKWGNVGHHSIGLFQSGISKLEKISIPAVNFDWDKDLKVKDTEEFIEWYEKCCSNGFIRGEKKQNKTIIKNKLDFQTKQVV